MGPELTPLRSDGLAPRAGIAASSSAEARASDPAAAPASSGSSFKALLDGLVDRAQELDRAAQGLHEPAELAGAVATARASLEDALSLRDQLLAAYRESVQRGEDDLES